MDFMRDTAPSTSAGAFQSEPGSADKPTKVDKHGQPKKKRKQLVACDSCRLRRVRCNKADVGLSDCAECSKKGIKCTDSYIRSKPKVVRSGKLILEAKRLYGDGEGASPKDIFKSEESPTTSPIPVLPQQSVVRSAEGRFITSELARSISNHLIEVYHQVVHCHLPVIDWDRFQAEWDASGRNTDAMPPTWECVSMVLQAWGSRHSDHPAMVGNNAPSLNEIPNMPFGTDLTVFGTMRDSFAKAMEERAMVTLDTRGALRRPSGASAGALLLMEFLCTFGDVYRGQGRHLMSCAVEHLRSRADGLSVDHSEGRSEQERQHGGVLFWVAFTRDALSSAFGGRLPYLTSDDIAVLCEIVAAPISEEPLAYVGSSDPAVLGGLAVISIFRHLNMVIRSFAVRVSGPLARRQRLSMEKVGEIWKAIDTSAHYMRVFRSSVSRANWATASVQHLTWFRDLITMRAQLLHSIHINIVDRLEIERRRPPGRDPLTFRYYQELEQMKATSDLTFLSVCREFTELVRSYPKDLVLVAALSCENITCYLAHMVEMPAWEDGGPPHYPMAAKHAEVTALVEAVKIAAWSWADYRRPCDAAHLVLGHLEARMAESRVLTPSAPHHLNSGFFAPGLAQPSLYSPVSTSLTPMPLNPMEDWRPFPASQTSSVYPQPPPAQFGYLDQHNGYHHQSPYPTALSPPRHLPSDVPPNFYPPEANGHSSSHSTGHSTPQGDLSFSWESIVKSEPM